MSPKRRKPKRARMRRVEVYGKRGAWKVTGLNDGGTTAYNESYSKLAVVRLVRARCRKEATPLAPISFYTRRKNGRWHLEASYGADPRGSKG